MRLFFISLFLTFYFYLSAQTLTSGALLFVSSSKSDFEKAINDVTNNKSRHNFSHVGIINSTDSGIFVIEATPKYGVTYTPISVLEQENKGKTLYIGSFKSQYRHWCPQAIIHALSLLGKTYDFAFNFDNDMYYCSELIYAAFAMASKDKNVFLTPPMTFKPSPEADFLPYWVDYFAKLNIPIPEDKPGINPNGISHSDKLESLKKYKQ